MLEPDSPHPNHQFGAMHIYPAGVISLTDMSSALRELQNVAYSYERRGLPEHQMLKHRPAIDLGRTLLSELVDMLLYWNQTREPRTLNQLAEDLEYCTKFWTAFSAYTPSKTYRSEMVDTLAPVLLNDYKKLAGLVGSIVKGPTWHIWSVLHCGDNSILVDRGDYRIVQWHLAQELAAGKAKKEKTVPMSGVMTLGNLTREEEQSLVQRESIKRLIEDIQRQSMQSMEQDVETDPVVERSTRTKKK